MVMAMTLRMVLPSHGGGCFPAWYRFFTGQGADLVDVLDQLGPWLEQLPSILDSVIREAPVSFCL
jgi:hypothetical protein